MDWKFGIGWIIFLLLTMIFSCQKEEPAKEIYYNIPNGFPFPSFPSDNEFTHSRFLLGRKLFYDPILSNDSTISCSSCHIPEFAFTDRKLVSKGIMSRIGTRNSPSLSNVDYQPYLLRESGVPTLEMQVGVPIRNIALTGPYMHYSRFKTLEEVINHYNSNVNASSTSSTFLLHNINGLNLTNQDKADLIAFLNTLSDSTYLNNPEYQSLF